MTFEREAYNGTVSDDTNLNYYSPSFAAAAGHDDINTETVTDTYHNKDVTANKVSTTAEARASIQNEKLLTSTISSLLSKFIPVLQKRSSHNNNSSGGVDIPNGAHYKSTGLNDDDATDTIADFLDIESQSFETTSHSTAQAQTPKVHNNFKTTGLEEDQQQSPPLQRQDSSEEYLPQSAALLLNTLQHANFDRCSTEEILSSMLRSTGSNDSLDMNNLDNSSIGKCGSEEDDSSISGDLDRLGRSIACLQRDLDNIDMGGFDDMVNGLEDQQLLPLYQGDGVVGNARGKGWKRWIRNWLLSHGLIEDEKMVNLLLTEDNDENDGAATPGRGGLSIFDFERDSILVVILLLVFFVLLRNRFHTLNELLFEQQQQGGWGEEELEGILGSDW